MPQTAWLTIRATKKPWFQMVNSLAIAGALLFVGSAFLHRTLLTANNPLAAKISWMLPITGILALTGFVAVYLSQKQKLPGAYYPKRADMLGLSVENIFLGAQTIPVPELKKIIIESAQYAGAPAGRTTASGFGQVSIAYKVSTQEMCFPIIIQSAQELKQLRELSAAWRLLGLTALVMN
jgi:hypothetical protein